MRSLRPLLLLAALLMSSCADNECNFNSQCGARRYCERGSCFQDCAADLDCPSDSFCSAIGQCEVGPRDMGVDAPDAFVDASVDMFTPPPDASRDFAVDLRPPVDMREVAVPPVDMGVEEGVDEGVDMAVDMAPLRGRLEACGIDGECASGFCRDGRCSIVCSGNGDCTLDEVCAGGTCRIDDTGAMCSAATPESCALGLCASSVTGGGECTRPCGDASDCPAGHACTSLGGMQVCVNIEKRCNSPEDCATGFCLTVQGCTATCRTAADCPARATRLGVPPYTCERAFGSSDPICVPPDDIVGPDALGSACATSGLNQCRSGLCNAEAPAGPMCVQTCTADGGCPPGFGCKPEELGGGVIELLCARAGTRTIGESCTRAAECESALCNAPGYCTRLCDDGLCPAGFRCDPLPGVTSRLCVRL
ncbi:MAG: hypothetical protein AAF645_10520 [Myxococcota bacterium]